VTFAAIRSFDEAAKLFHKWVISDLPQAIDMKTLANKTHLYKKGFALSVSVFFKP